METMITKENEIWKDVFGFEGLYEVSNLGNIRALYKKVICKNGAVKHLKSKPIVTSYLKGYKIVSLYKHGARYNRYVHRIVANAFIEKVEGKTEINHINGVRGDARVENLEWCSHLENMNKPNTVALIRDASLKVSQQLIATNIITGDKIPFASINQASEYLGQKSNGGITGFLKGERAHVKGFVFEKVDDLRSNKIKLYTKIMRKCASMIETLQKGQS